MCKGNLSVAITALLSRGSILDLEVAISPLLSSPLLFSPLVRRGIGAISITFDLGVFPVAGLQLMWTCRPQWHLWSWRMGARLKAAFLEPIFQYLVKLVSHSLVNLLSCSTCLHFRFNFQTISWTVYSKHYLICPCSGLQGICLIRPLYTQDSCPLFLWKCKLSLLKHSSSKLSKVSMCRGNQHTSFYNLYLQNIL